MKINKGTSKKTFLFLLSYFILWIILFEFILPVNQILPKPSIVFLSFSALWQFYKLPVNFITTISVVYFSLFAAYFIIYMFRNFLLKHNHIFTDFILSLNWFSKYVPGIIFGLFLIFWLPDSNYIGFIFAFSTSFFSMLIKLKEETINIKHEYVDAAKSLGADESVVRRKILWDASQPGLIKHLFELHFYIWSVLIVFEFINGGYGLGNIFRLALQYRDLSALFTNAIIIGVTIFLGSHVIRYIRNKFFHWSIF